MRRHLFFATAIGLLLAGLWFADTHLIAPTTPATRPTVVSLAPQPSPTPLPKGKPRVVVLALAGAGSERVERYRLQGTMPHLQRLAKEGAHAAYALSVDPADSAPAHAALATGAFPGTTGIVANRYHRARDDLDSVIDARAALPLQTEPVWRAAMRRGLHAAAICWPGLGPAASTILPDYTVTEGIIDAPSALHVVTFTTALSWTTMPSSFAPPREGILAIRKNGSPLAHLYLLALDTTDDQRVNYDRIILSHGRWASSENPLLRVGDTLPFTLAPHLLGGAYFSLISLNGQSATIYQSAVCYNDAYPDELLRQINALGYCPPPPDEEALRLGWITPEQYLQQAEIRSHWVMTVTHFVLERYHPDVLFVGQGTAEWLQRPFLPAEPQQPGYDPVQAAEGERLVRAGYRLADEALDSLCQALDLQRTALFVVSDRGLASVHTQANLNALLAQLKLLCYLPGSEQINRQRSQAFAIGQGGSAHIYISLRGRERSGIVAGEQQQALVDAIAAALAELRDADGAPVFARILRRDELGQLNLQADGTGDLFIQAVPGVVLNDEPDAAALLTAPIGRAASGYEATQPSMFGILVAGGAGIRQGVEIGPVHVCDLAPTVAHLLDIDPPQTATGRVLDEMLR